MFKGVIIKNLKKYTDDRGWLSELYRSDEIDFEPTMAYASLTRPGVVRGPHEHKYQSDCFFFVGPGNFKLHLWDRREGSDTEGEHFEAEFGEDNPAMVIVPPGVVHGYKCIGNTVAYSLNMPDRLYKGRRKEEEVDEIRWEEDDNSPYRIE